MNFFPVVLRPNLHLRQEFFAELFAPNIPASLERGQIFFLFASPAPFHTPLELLATGGAVHRNAVLTLQTVGSKPHPTRTARFEILPVATPGKRGELLLGSNEFGARGVEMDVIAKALEVTGAAVID